jgi:3-(3-hydroxy-phenyl)propionate hydroxylase
VASDGGRSFIRTTLGIGFGGFTDTSKWLVVDIRNDPLGVPNIYMHSDPQRPYVSVALPDGVRRFEFMIFEDETEEQVTTPERMAELLAKVLPAHVDISRLDFIRKRVYTHNARIAERWKIGRIMLAGDAAHIMPVWQGQGYNTGMRDATNLAWKLAYVVNGRAATRSRNLPVGAPAARQGDDRPVGHRRAHLLAAQRLPGRPARRDLGAQLHPAGQALLHGDALQADALLRERPGGA